MNKSIINNFISTLNNSSEELLVSLTYLKNNCNEWKLKFDQAKFIQKNEKLLVETYFLVLDGGVNRIISDVNLLKDEINHMENKKVTEIILDNFILREKNFYARLRICYSYFASIATCLNWQSPSIKSSLSSRIGIEKDIIKADWNDYKRDRSADTFCVENLYKKKIFTTELSGTDSVLNIFNSGMAAFTTIIYFLICEGIVKNKVLVSSQVYVESLMLLKKFFRENILYFNHNNTDEIIQYIFTNEPSVVFIEPISNTKILRLFDVSRIINEISKSYKKDIFFIVDVTCSIGFDNFLSEITVPGNIKIIVHGSILKAPQLGLERVNAGFVQVFNLGKLAEKVLDYRTLSGTNIQDFASNLLPMTTKKLLRNRMKTIESNAVKLANLFLKIDINHDIIQEIVYPGLKNHPDYKLSQKIGFAGFFFNIIFVPKYNHDKYFALYTGEVIRIASERGCDLVHGASFGFNKTSIYYSVGWDEPDNHYIRISTGTETVFEVKKIESVLVDAFESFKKLLKELKST